MLFTTVADFEQTYRQMGEGLIGSVRPIPNNGWLWMSDGQSCFYMRDPEEDAGLLTMFDEQLEGSMVVKQFCFKGNRILSTYDFMLDSEELQMKGVGRYILDLHMFKIDVEGLTPPSAEDEALFWQTLGAPLQELRP